MKRGEVRCEGDASCGAAQPQPLLEWRMRGVEGKEKAAAMVDGGGEAWLRF